MVQPKGEVENLQPRLLDCYHIGRARKACRILLHGEEQKLLTWQHRRKVLPKGRSRGTSPSQDSHKQSRRTKYENHVVSKQILDCAAKHRRTIVLEKLENVRCGRIRHDSDESQWSF
jgi:hypothetical protein